MRATLGGVPLLATAPVGWSLVPGAKPHEETFQVATPEVAGLLALPQPLTLEMSGWYYGTSFIEETHTVKGLYILGTSPTTSEHVTAVTVADERHWWQRYRVDTRLNHKRRAAGLRRIDANGNLGPLAPTTPDIEYEPATLNSGQPYTALSAVLKLFEDANVPPPSVVGASSIDAPMPQEGTHRGYLSDEVSRAMGRLRRAELWPLVSGSTWGGGFVLQQAIPGDERQPIDQLQQPLRGAILPAMSDLSRVRPSRVRVSFAVEEEVMVYGYEPITLTTRQEPRRLFNVCSVPDDSVTLNGKTVIRDSVVSLLALANYYQSNPASDQRTANNIPPLSLDLLRKMYVLPQGFVNLFTAVPGPIITARIETLKRDYRLRWRMRQELRDKIESWRTERIGIADPETGFVPPSLPRVEHTRMLSEYSRHKGGAGPVGQRIFVNSGEVHTDSWQNSETTPGWSLRVESQDLGIMRISALNDPLNRWSKLLPGWAEGATVQEAPWFDLRQASSFGCFEQDFNLRSRFRMAAIISVVWSVPNSRRRRYILDILPSDVSSLVGGTIGQANGPTWEVHIPYSPATAAQYPWLDSRAASMDAFLSEDDPVTSLPPGDPANLETLKALAKAEAARVYQSMQDRLEGGYHGPYQDVKPAGAMRAIRHEVGTDGALTTAVAVTPDVIVDEIAALLPDGMRRTLFREVQP